MVRTGGSTGRNTEMRDRSGRRKQWSRIIGLVIGLLRSCMQRKRKFMSEDLVKGCYHHYDKNVN